MKRFKLLPIALVLVLIAVPLAPATVLADSLTGFSVELTDQTPSANATYTVNFETATPLTGCSPGSTFSQFIIQIEKVAVIPPADNYTLIINDTPQTWESGGGPPSAYGNYTVTVIDDFPFDTIYIKYCHKRKSPVAAVAKSVGFE